jgi:hypothetical protein
VPALYYGYHQSVDRKFQAKLQKYNNVNPDNLPVSITDPDMPKQANRQASIAAGDGRAHASSWFTVYVACISQSTLIRLRNSFHWMGSSTHCEDLLEVARDPEASVRWIVLLLQ